MLMGIFSLFIFAVMSSMESARRLRIVQFFEKNRGKGKVATVQHFLEEGVSRRTTYNVIKQYEEHGTCDRKSGSGHKPLIMTAKVVKSVKKNLLSTRPPSTRALARTLGCSQPHVVKALKKKTDLQCRKKAKSACLHP
jgi:transposase